MSNENGADDEPLPHTKFHFQTLTQGRSVNDEILTAGEGVLAGNAEDGNRGNLYRAESGRFDDVNWNKYHSEALWEL